MRWRLVEELHFAGPATATELAERVGESPANCSWHLRQLAKYGFVEEAPGGRGRQRPWQIVVRRYEVDEEDPHAAIAGRALGEMIYAREFEAMRIAWDALPFEPPEWQRALFTNQAFAWCTAEELDDIGQQIVALQLKYLHRVDDPASRPKGARPIRFLAWGIPARPYQKPAAEPSGKSSNPPPERSE